MKIFSFVGSSGALVLVDTEINNIVKENYLYYKLYNGNAPWILILWIMRVCFTFIYFGRVSCK